MGGERSSTTRRREAGKICCVCHVPLDTPPWQQPVERYCPRCAPHHKILMNFMLRDGWHISFLEADCRTPLPHKLTFADPDKIREMNRRFGSRIAEDVSAVEYAIGIGRGSIWLTLDRGQYEVLKRGKKPPQPTR